MTLIPDMKLVMVYYIELVCRLQLAHIIELWMENSITIINTILKTNHLFVRTIFLSAKKIEIKMKKRKFTYEYNVKI